MLNHSLWISGIAIGTAIPALACSSILDNDLAANVHSHILRLMHANNILRFYFFYSEEGGCF